MNCIEQLEWIGVGTLPDTDTTVICWGPDGFFCGWWSSLEVLLVRLRKRRHR